MKTTLMTTGDTPLCSPIGILPHKAISGLNTLDDIPELNPMLTGSLQDLLDVEYDTDAHFACYWVEGEEVYPRINKNGLGALNAAGVAVMCSFFAIDFDNPEHAEMNEDLLCDWLEQLESLPAPLDQWCCHYTTKHGARLIYAFEEPMNAEAAEGYVLGIHRALQLQGLDPDGKAAEWNRLFRCPKVKRDGANTWEHDYFIIDWQECNLRLSDIEPIESGSGMARYVTGGSYKYIDYGELPEYGECKKLLEVFNPTTGRIVQTQWYKAAKKRLRGRECFDALFNGSPLAEKGSRDDTLLKFIGSAVKMFVVAPEGTTPRHVYALFMDPVSDFEDDEDWQSNLWSKITRIWNAESVHKEAESKTMEEFGMSSEEKLDALAMGMNEWCEHQALVSQDMKIRRQFIQRHSIVSNRNCFYIIRPDGFYERMDVSQNQLIPRIEISGMSDIIETWIPTDDGAKAKNVNQIINEYSTPVNDIRVVPQIKGGYIRDMDTDHSTLYIPGYRRSTKLTPQYNEEVDTWLALLGGDHYDDLCKWIALSLDFEGGPICAMSISGAPGAGKKMIIEGLAECLQQPVHATAKDLTDKRQSGLLRSPFVIINEGWPKSRSEDISAQFRSMVGGDTLVIDEKFKPLMYVNNPARILLTANNDVMVQEITDGKDLSPNDRKAIADRLYHFEATEEATEYLKELGGKNYTGREGNRWIRGDGTATSDHIVAKHFLYLYANRHRYEVGNRLLMHGNVTTSSALMHKMLTGQGYAPLVIESLIDMIESMGMGANSRGIAQVDGEMYVVSKSIQDHFRTSFKDKTKNELRLDSIDRVMKNLVKVQTGKAFVLKGYEDESFRMWHKLDLKQLLRTAERYGHKCSRLRKLIAAN